MPDADKVVARVNGKPIVKRQVYELSTVNKARLQAQGVRMPSDGDLRRGSLKLIIDGELMKQAAAAAGLKVDPAEVDKAVQHVRGQFKAEDDFKKYLTASGLTEAGLRSEAESRLLMQAYQNSIIGGVKASDEATRTFYDANKEQIKSPEEARVLMILVTTQPNDPPAKKDEARKRIDEAVGKLKAGEDFAKVAKQYSQAPNAVKGGDTGFFPRGVMFPKFEEMSFTLPAGQVSEVFETPKGLNVIKVVERRQPQILPYDSIKTRLTDDMTASLQGQALDAKLRELRSKAKIEILDPELQAPPGAPPAAKK
jgi:parvulin-like peptidyl-prolyl isomerase